MAKMTKREKFVEVANALDGVGATELAEFINGEIALIDKRKVADRKPTAAQIANVGVKDNIVSVLANGERTATEIGGALDITTQKASALLRQLVAEGFVSKTEARGKERAKFALVG